MMERVPETIVLLHGFTQTGAGWRPIAAALGAGYTPVARDLRGHGTAAGRRPVDLEGTVADVVAAAPERFALAGYSMGGRIALHVALAHPERVTRLALIGASPGLEDPAERAARRRSDEEWARLLEREGIDAFADRWAAQPVIAGQPASADTIRRAQSPAGLAAALRGLGTGALPAVWDRLGELPMPVTLIVGEHDAKFRAIGERMAAAIPDARLVVVPGAGHAVQLEAPDAVVAALRGTNVPQYPR
jgi:2-succinyl-6-hydroxy-2,4-cyclohexadiene-1-carboxylate synthase